MGPMILLAFLFLTTYSCAESDKQKRSIFGENYHGHLLANKKFTFGNIVNLGHTIDPFTANEELSLSNSFSLQQHERHLPTSYLNNIQENSFKFLPTATDLISEHKEEFIPSSFDKSTPLENYFTNEKYQEKHFENSFEQYHDDPVKPPPDEYPIHKNHFVAFGSGSLGATKLPNGQIVIGSGSLGYGGANNNKNNNGINIFSNQLDNNLQNLNVGPKESFSNNLFTPATLRSTSEKEFPNGFPYFIQ